MWQGCLLVKRIRHPLLNPGDLREENSRVAERDDDERTETTKTSLTNFWPPKLQPWNSFEVPIIAGHAHNAVCLHCRKMGCISC